MLAQWLFSVLWIPPSDWIDAFPQHNIIRQYNAQLDAQAPIGKFLYTVKYGVNIVVGFNWLASVNANWLLKFLTKVTKVYRSSF